MYYLQEDMKCRVPAFHRELYNLAYEGHKRIVVAAPRSFAKSTVFSKIYPLYQILNGDIGRIMIVSSTAMLAEHWLREIQRELTENKYILSDYGNVKTEKWASDYIICSVRGRKVEVQAKGRAYQMRGWRPDLIILDDLEDDEQVRSEDQRAKLTDWFNKALINTLESVSQLIYIGTILHPLSLLSDVLNRENWITRKYQAISPDNKSLWPEKWPLSALLERKKEIGALAFQSEFMNDPLITENPIFVRDWIHNYDKDDLSFKKNVSDGMYVVSSIDPAISRKESSDYTGVVTLGATFDKTPKIYVLDVRRGHWPLHKQIYELDDVYLKHKVNKIVIETVAYQQALSDEFKLYCDEHRRFPNVKEVKPDRDKERRAHSIVPLLERSQVLFDMTDSMTQKLIDELLVFPTGDHDDLVDAFVYALIEIREWSRRESLKKKHSEPYIVLPGKGRRSTVTGIVY